MKAIIFDLDQTLVDSRHIEHLRRSRQWSIVYQKIPTILAYDGINEVLSVTRDNGIKLQELGDNPRKESSVGNMVIFPTVDGIIPTKKDEENGG